METLFAPLDLQLGKKLWNECSTSSAHNGPTIRLPSLFALPVSATSNSSIKITTSERSPRIVTMSDLLSSQLSPLKEKTTMRLPSICTMINHDANSRDLTHVRIHSINLDMQLQDIKTASPRQPELKLENLLADTNTKQLDNFDLAQKNRSILRFGNTQPKRNSNAKLCGMTDCMKRAKAGGFCIAHGGGLRCSKVDCMKHAVSIGLCISHGGGKRCTVKGCPNASRKDGVCWSHGGKRLCKLEGCEKGPKSGGYCWRHGGRMRK